MKILKNIKNEKVLKIVCNTFIFIKLVCEFDNDDHFSFALGKG